MRRRGGSTPVLNSERAQLRSHMPAVLYVLLMAAVIVAVDVLFFKNQFWPRLLVNVGIVLVFAAFYFRFQNRP
jgi:hypothetical protein